MLLAYPEGYMSKCRSESYSTRILCDCEQLYRICRTVGFGSAKKPTWHQGYKTVSMLYSTMSTERENYPAAKLLAF